MLDLVSPQTLIKELRLCSKLIDAESAIERVALASDPISEVPADATMKLVCMGAHSPPVFVTVSGEGNPDLVARAARNIRDVRGLLSERSAEPVLEPLETGEVLERSFAVWPMLSDLPQGRVPRYLAKRLIRPDVLNWISDVFAETYSYATADERQVIAANLARLVEDQHHPDRLRRAAGIAAERLESGQWAPVHCVQHSDLWMGNIMLAPPGFSTSFCVIDWAGARCKGYPFFDLFRFALSSNASLRVVRAQVREQLGRLKADPVDSTSYVLCALGQVQSQLEFFPEKLFRQMALETTDFALKIGK